MPLNRPFLYVTCSINMRFAPTAKDRAVNLLLSAVGVTQAKLGCISCIVARDVAEDGRIRYAEEWESEEVFQRHLRSDEFRRVLVAMDMCLEEPEVVIGNLSGRSGMAYLEELAGKK